MSRYLYALEHTGRAFAPAERIPDTAWRELSRHTSRRAAYNALRLARQEMLRACGVGAWNDHFRVTALRSHRVRYAHYCWGWIDAAGRSHWCEDAAEAHTAGVWEAGQPAPPVGTPQGWAGPSQCAACAERERAIERVT